MERPLLDGGCSVTSASSKIIDPREVSSKPPIILKSVDLPHPEGPTKIMNSPSIISKSIPLITCKSSNHFSTALSFMDPII